MLKSEKNHVRGKKHNKGYGLKVVTDQVIMYGDDLECLWLFCVRNMGFVASHA